MSSTWPIKRVYTAAETQKEELYERLRRETQHKMLQFYLSPKSRFIILLARLNDAKRSNKSRGLISLFRQFNLADGSMNNFLWLELFKAVYGVSPSDDTDWRWNELFGIRKGYAAQQWAINEAKRLTSQKWGRLWPSVRHPFTSKRAA